MLSATYSDWFDLVRLNSWWSLVPSKEARCRFLAELWGQQEGRLLVLQSPGTAGRCKVAFGGQACICLSDNAAERHGLL